MAHPLAMQELQMVIRHFPNGLNFTDIGFLLGLSNKATEMIFLRALNKLRSHPARLKPFIEAVADQRHYLDQHRGNSPETDIDAGLDIDLAPAA